MPPGFLKCPKCGHVRQPDDTAPAEQCPACGIYFAKWLLRDSFVPPSLRKEETEQATETEQWRNKILGRILHVPPNVSNAQIWSRGAILVFLLVWGFRIANMDYRDGEMGQSFMHSILLPIHEAGHILFIPLGEFMTILGGSLFQILFPLIMAGALLWQNRDAFGCAVGAWWTSISLIDLAPYIYDARQPQLILLGGHTGDDGPHDWIYLLGHFGKLQRSQIYGAWAHHLGFALMLLSLVAAFWALWRWYSAKDFAEAG
ncbi:MAG: hypothetical protein WAO76_14465 [Georgfuchsia sp.]